MKTSRLPGLYKLSPSERLAQLEAEGIITQEQGAFLLSTQTDGFPLSVADRMVENVIGVLGLPIGLGLNFLINRTEYVVPMAIEEPSVVAAVSGAAKLVRDAGGFEAQATEPLMLGQIQLTGCPDPFGAREALLDATPQLLDYANALCPKMVDRGGGAKEINVRVLGDGQPLSNGEDTIVVVHVVIDTRDAMGANTINTVAEGLANHVEEIAGGAVHLRILSNLSDRCRASANCSIPAEQLAGKGFSGAVVAKRIALASRFAEEDPYRAATHNKGIMNGIDGVAIATGNDWRAIEAGAHAFAVKDGRYGPLARWKVAESGDLVGEIELPLAVGTVGGSAEVHPTVKVLRSILGVTTGSELRQVMASVGLAQNLAALRALATEGIQRGHMALHARSVALVAGASPENVERVAARMVETGEVKVWKARQIIESLQD